MRVPSIRETFQRIWEPLNAPFVSTLGVRRPREEKALVQSHAVSMGPETGLEPRGLDAQFYMTLISNTSSVLRRILRPHPGTKGKE